jgi:hypothetical protein
MLTPEQIRYTLELVNRHDADVCKVGKPCNGRCIPKDHKCGGEEEVEKGYLVYFEGRRTPVAVAAKSKKEAIEKSRKLKKRGGDRVVSTREATEQERAIAAKGKWIRTGPNGEKPGKSEMRGHGPEPKAWRATQV